MMESTVRPEVIDLCARIDAWVVSARLAGSGRSRELGVEAQALNQSAFELLIDGDLNNREKQTLSCETDRIREHFFLLIESRLDEIGAQRSGNSS